MSYCSLSCDDLEPLCETLSALSECPCEGKYEIRAGFEAPCRATLSCRNYSHNSSDRDECLLASLCETKCDLYKSPPYCHCSTVDVL